jgi:hypothetical protein
MGDVVDSFLGELGLGFERFGCVEDSCEEFRRLLFRCNELIGGVLLFEADGGGEFDLGGGVSLLVRDDGGVVLRDSGGGFSHFLVTDFFGGVSFYGEEYCFEDVCECVCGDGMVDGLGECVSCLRGLDYSAYREDFLWNYSHFEDVSYVGFDDSFCGVGGVCYDVVDNRFVLIGDGGGVFGYLDVPPSGYFDVLMLFMYCEEFGECLGLVEEDVGELVDCFSECEGLLLDEFEEELVSYNI